MPKKKKTAKRQVSLKDFLFKSPFSIISFGIKCGRSFSQACIVCAIADCKMRCASFAICSKTSSTERKTALKRVGDPIKFRAATEQNIYSL